MLAQMVKCLPATRKTRVWSLGREDALEKEMATHSSTLAWSILWMDEPGRLQSMGLQKVGHDWATSLITKEGISKVALVVKNLPTKAGDLKRHGFGVWCLGEDDPLEEGMTTYSSALACRIPRAEEPGRLQSMGSQRVGHDWSNSACMHSHYKRKLGNTEKGMVYSVIIVTNTIQFSNTIWL